MILHRRIFFSSFIKYCCRTSFRSNIFTFYFIIALLSIHYTYLCKINWLPSTRNVNMHCCDTKGLENGRPVIFRFISWRHQTAYLQSQLIPCNPQASLCAWFLMVKILFPLPNHVLSLITWHCCCMQYMWICFTVIFIWAQWYIPYAYAFTMIWAIEYCRKT